jgi:hypothetical protein
VPLYHIAKVRTCSKTEPCGSKSTQRTHLAASITRKPTEHLDQKFISDCYRRRITIKTSEISTITFVAAWKYSTNFITIASRQQLFKIFWRKFFKSPHMNRRKKNIAKLTIVENAIIPYVEYRCH